MNYNPWIDIALLGAALLLIGVIIIRSQRPRKGAERVDRKELERHQAVRRILMRDGEYK